MREVIVSIRGEKVKITAPDGTTDEELKAALNKKFPKPEPITIPPVEIAPIKVEVPDVERLIRTVSESSSSAVKSTELMAGSLRGLANKPDPVTPDPVGWMVEIINREGEVEKRLRFRPIV